MRIERAIASAVTVTVLAFFTYFDGYQNPPFFFWDENYHVAHAQKYLNSVFFMEPHPPLGKLVIAAGEYLLDANERDDQFIGTDHAPNSPPGFSFAGYRLFPALFAWLTAPLLFFVLLLVSRQVWVALLATLPYVFDNALIVHGRGAMLESTQLFFVVLYLAAFLCLTRFRTHKFLFCLSATILGASLAAVLTTKINGLILIITVPFLLLWLGRSGLLWRRLAVCSLTSFVFVFITVWQIHFALGRNIQSSLPDSGFYQASDRYKQILKQQQNASPLNFPTMLRDSFAFIPHYQRGVPRLNLCNQNENGSPAWLWPIGARAINYRWNRNNDLTSYLFLQVNPAAWALALIGVLGSLSLLVAGVFKPFRRRLKRGALLWMFSSMYLGYMLVMSQLTRVMYLYHYFIPLIFSFVLFTLFISELSHLGSLRLKFNWKIFALSLSSVIVVLCYAFFSPLTYAKPLSNEQLAERSWIAAWDLRCPDCGLTNLFARPTCDPKVKPFPDAWLGPIRAQYAKQDWGEPKANSALEEVGLKVGGKSYPQGIGTHANSNIRFKLAGNYSLVSGLVGVPDYMDNKPGKPATVVFEILGDGRRLWESPIMRAQTGAQAFSVDVHGVDSLELVTRDGGDGINNDHACWLSLQVN